MNEPAVAAVDAPEQPKVLKFNPYVAALATQLREVVTERVTHDDALTQAEYVVSILVTPKNERIHGLHNELARLQAEVGRLGKVLDRHNEGEWHKDKESPVDCAMRMLSPAPDNMPKRDRP